jgi:hypothetical protein
MKSKGLKMPLTVAFSGNGSKTLRVLSDDRGTLSKYVRLVFEGVYGEKYDEVSMVEIKFEDEPKKATCKGGILNQTDQGFDTIDAIKCSLIGYDMQTFARKESHYAEITSSEDLQGKIVQTVKDFVDFTFELHKNNDSFYTKKFDLDAGISAKVYDACQRGLKEYLKLGLTKKLDELQILGADKIIEETMFFYPITGMLNHLAREINTYPK